MIAQLECIVCLSYIKNNVLHPVLGKLSYYNIITFQGKSNIT